MTSENADFWDRVDVCVPVRTAVGHAVMLMSMGFMKKPIRVKRRDAFFGPDGVAASGPRKQA